MFKLCCNIKIGKYSFDSIAHLSYERSIYDIVGKGSLKIPLTVGIKSNEQLAMQQSASIFKVGDEVAIKLGYNDTLNLEFAGYVKKLNYTTPLEIELEDEAYSLRQKNVKQLFSKKKIKDIATACGIREYEATPIDMEVEKFVSFDKTGLWVMEELRTQFGLGIYFTKEKKCYLGLQYGRNIGEVNYDLTQNVVNAGELKWQNAEDVKIKIRAYSFTNNGKKIEATAGSDGGEIRTLHYVGVKDKAMLKDIAERDIEKYAYTGYQGSITTFGEPFADIGMIANINDPQYPDRSGKYYIEKIEVEFGESGFRRKIHIGRKI